MTGEAVLGVVLAGGLARRMGADKAMVRIAGRTMLARAVARLAPQCDGLILSANGDPSRFGSAGWPVVADPTEGFQGPLAGLLGALEWAAARRPAVGWVVSLPVDCPFAPRDLVARLRAAATAQGAPLALAESGGRAHPTAALWRLALRDELRRALLKGERKVDRFADRFRPAVVAWPNAPLDPFFNVNAPEDVAEAERLAPLDGD